MRFGDGRLEIGITAAPGRDAPNGGNNSDGARPVRRLDAKAFIRYLFAVYRRTEMISYYYLLSSFD